MIVRATNNPPVDLSVEDRLARLEAVQAIGRVLTDFAFGADNRDPGRLLAAFHDDAVFDVDFGGKILTGHTEILTWANDLWKLKDINHLAGNADIEVVDETHAIGMSQGIGIFKMPDDSVIFIIARLNDRYLAKAGKWRLAYRKVRNLSSYRLHADDLGGQVG